MSLFLNQMIWNNKCFALAEGVVGHCGASGIRATVDLKNDRVVVILTKVGSKNARPLIGGGHKLAMEILANENKK